MGASISVYVLMLLFLSSVNACRKCVHQSKAAFFSSSSPLSAGACRYGSMALRLNGGYVAAASSALYRGGVSCGACFQIRCKNTRLCSSRGVKVIITDLNKSNAADLVLSGPAFAAMGRDAMGQELKKLGMVEVEYKRIPCEYQRRTIRVDESSKKPNNLAIKFPERPTDIVAVDVATVGSLDWRFMNRSDRAVWATSRAPVGPLQLRIVMMAGGNDGKWVWAEGEVLPAEWRAGAVYHSGIQITDIDQGGCSLWDAEEWK